MADLDTPLQVEDNTPDDVKEVGEFVRAEPTPELSKEPMPSLAGDYLPLKNFYGVGDLDQETQSKLQFVWEHFAQDAKTPSTVLNRIRVEHHNMAQPNLGDTRLNQMYSYVKILKDIQEAQAVKQAYRK